MLNTIKFNSNKTSLRLIYFMNNKSTIIFYIVNFKLLLDLKDNDGNKGVSYFRTFTNETFLIMNK